jgi:hypothetical protein
VGNIIMKELDKIILKNVFKVPPGGFRGEKYGK